jgi:hypothetical protein
MAAVSPFSPGLRGHRRTYLTILEPADHALFKMERLFLSTTSQAGARC